VFFGSSTTAGSGTSATEKSWTHRVASALGWVEVNRGLSGSMLTHRLDEPIPSGEGRAGEVIREAPDGVVVMYGANDAAARWPIGDERTPGTFHHAAAALLQRLRAALPHALLVVCTPQPAAALAPDARPRYDAVLEVEARRVGAVFVPAHRAFGPERLPALSADTIHLNDAGHAVLADFVTEVLSRQLAESGAVVLY
jgi:lysophospholipase L1-like esterase